MWPFTRAWPLGLVNNQVPTHSDLNKLDEQIAQAADGSVYTDIALLRNLLAAETFAGAGTDVIGRALLWEPTKGQWWSFGTTTGNVSTAYRSSNGGDWAPSPLVTDCPATTWTLANASCHNAGIIVLAGKATDASKVRYSGNGGGVWTPANTVHSGAAEDPLCIAFAPSANRWVMGFNINATNNIETADGSLTVWTQRTNALALACVGIAVSATRIVIITNGGSQCVTSEDGITWTARTLPSSATWSSVAYNAVTGKFMILGSGGNKIAVSADGITWTDAGLTNPIATLTRGLVVVGRLWVALGDASAPELYVSANDGVSWKKISNALFDGIAAGQSQILMATGNVTKRSLMGGL